MCAACIRWWWKPSGLHFLSPLLSSLLSSSSCQAPQSETTVESCLKEHHQEH
jgi:hypothetical protein